MYYFFVVSDAHICAGQAVRINCMELGAGIRTVDCFDHLDRILDLIGYRHWIA